MKSIFQHSQNLFAAALIAAPLLVASADSARAQSDAAAQKLANGFARESENDERSRKRAATRAAAQIAAEKSAMQAARREAVAAKDNAELQAYRKDLMERVRREADKHRKAALARVKEQQRRVDAEKMAGKKITAQREAAKARKAALAKRQELANRKAQEKKLANATKRRLVQEKRKAAQAKKRKLAENRRLGKRRAATQKREKLAQQQAASRQAARQQKAALKKSARDKTAKPKYVILNGKINQVKPATAARNKFNNVNRKTASRGAPVSKRERNKARQSRSSKIGSYGTRARVRNSGLEAAALHAESARLSRLEKVRDAELLDLDDKLARITARRKADALARKEVDTKEADAKEAEARAERDGDDRQLEAQRLERTKRVHVEQAQNRSSRAVRTDPAWERDEAARLTREAARRFSDRLAARDRGDGAGRSAGSYRSYDQQRWGSRAQDQGRTAVFGRSDLDDKFERGNRATRADRRGLGDDRFNDNRIDDNRFNDNRFARRDSLGNDRLGSKSGRKDFDLDAPRAGHQRADELAGERDDGRADSDVIISRYAPPTSPPIAPSDDRAPTLSPAVQTGPVLPASPVRPAARGRPSHVTVLLLMKPGRRGIRRFNKTADPILCVRGGCYVSRGAGSPARFLARRRALGPKNTFGRRAGACKHQLGCVFRNVRLGSNALALQPVDMRVMRHDRRARQVVDAPSRCEVENGALTCSNAFNSHDYQMWVIPEDVAAQAGAGGLQAALAAGLRVSTPRAAAGFSEAGYNFRKINRRDQY